MLLEKNQKRLHLRKRAIALLKQGYTQLEVARILKTTRTTVYRWHVLYRALGDEGLEIKKTGRPSQLSFAQKKELVELLSQEPRIYGYTASQWSLSLIASLIRTHFGWLSCSPTAVRRLFLEQLQWRPENMRRYRPRKARSTSAGIG